MPRFVILYHAMPNQAERASHWDFMLETPCGLRTWACDAAPLAQPITLATALALHRLDYLHYEGEISGNRGSVTRIQDGEYTILHESEQQLTLCLITSTGTWQVELINLRGTQWQISTSPGSLES